VAHPGGPPEAAAFGFTAADEAGPLGIGAEADAEEAAEPAPPDPDEDEPVVAAGLDDNEEADGDEHPATAAAVTAMTRPAAPVSTVLRSVISAPFLSAADPRLTLRFMKVGTPLRRCPISSGWREIMSGSRRG